MTKTIGQTLVSLHMITPEQLREAEQQTTLPPEQYLLNKTIITHAQLAKAYAQFASVPFIDTITEQMAEISLLAKAPLKFLRDNFIIPLKVDGKTTIVTASPTNFQAIDELSMLLSGINKLAIAPEPVIGEAINRYYPLQGAGQVIAELEEEEDKELNEVEFSDIEEKDIMSMAAEAPIIKLVNHILFQAAKKGASDIHIEPFEKELVVRYRIDGVMYNILNPPKRLQSALISRIKIMSNLNIAEKRIPQDGRIDLKIAGKAIDIRVSILPVAFGERVVMRLLDKTRSFAKISDMDFSTRDYQLLEESIKRPNGILYVTGPTGSGKTTTLYSILSELNRPEVNIVTVEDPVEYQMAGVGQVQVREKIGLTFAAALRSILRQDPDIIMIGETRDAETAQIAIQSALTGHLVLSTLHTNSAPATITRLLDMGVEPYLIASSIHLAIAQRLVRKLCSACKKPTQPDQKLIASIGLNSEEAQKIQFFAPVGCEICSSSGYKGRIAIFELMAMTPEIAQLTIARADTIRLRKQAIADGMTLLVTDGLRKIKQGLTTIEEVLSVATMEEGDVA